MAQSRLHSRSGPARNPVPAEFGGDAVAWAVWLYYVDQLTQGEVATRLGVSRATIVNYLQEARERGLVTIQVDSAALSRTALARELAARHGLAGAYVIPEEGAVRPLRDRLGAAGARILAARLESEDLLGVAWGRSVLAVARALPALALPGVTVVQVAGSSLGGAEISPEFCTSILASRIGARCLNLHAPATLSSRRLRDELMAEPALERQFALIRRCRRILLGVGELTPATTFADAGFLTEGIAHEYRKRGAVAVLVGRFLDPDGREVSGPLDGRRIAISLDELRASPERLCIAGGPEKVPAIRAALAGRTLTHLVTDSPTAEALLKD